MCPVMIIGEPAAIAAWKGFQSLAFELVQLWPSGPAGPCANRTSPSRAPESASRPAAHRPPACPWRSRRSGLPPRRGSADMDRAPMVGSAGPMVTSASGAKPTVKPNGREFGRQRRRRPGLPGGRCRPHRSSWGDGQPVSGAPTRCTMPPSWSTPIRPGQVRPPDREAAPEPTGRGRQRRHVNQSAGRSGHVVSHDD